MYNNYWYDSKWQQANSTFVEIKIQDSENLADLVMAGLDEYIVIKKRCGDLID